MAQVLSAPQGFTVTGRDGCALLKWKEVSGAEGYRLFFYRSDEPDALFKARYSQKCTKSILGFTNGREYLAQVCAYVTENGREILGERSEKRAFVPLSVRLKAQKTLCLDIGETAQLNWEEANRIPEATFSSDDSAVAVVDEYGTVTAVAKGTAEITIVSETSQRFVTRVEVGRSLSCGEGRAVLMFAGDIMCTADQQRAAAAHGYDFHASFGRVREILDGADFSAAVLETSCFDGMPYEHEQRRSLEGLPNSNAPSTFISAAASAGFDALVTAANRSCSDGVLRLTANEIKHCGMRNIGTLGDCPVLTEVRGIKVAVIACTMITNGGMFRREGDPEYAALNGIYSREYFTRLVSSARSMGAEYIAAYQHWGVLNSSQVRKSQTEEARFMAEAGADIIIGSHPHMVQKVVYFRTADGRRVPCAYSLGNLLSSMSEMDGNRDGIILRAELRRTENGISSKISYIPLRSEDRYWGAEAVPVNAPYSDESRASLERTVSAVGKGISGFRFRPRVFLSGSAMLDRIFTYGGAFRCSRAAMRLSQLSLGCSQGVSPDGIGADVSDKLRLDLCKDLPAAIRAASPDIVAVDLYAAAFTACYKLTGEIGGEPQFFTNTKAFRQSEFFGRSRDSLTKINPPFGEAVWKPLIKRYAEKLLSVMPPERIILFRTQFGTHSAKENELRISHPKKNLNRFMRAMEDYFISIVKPLTVELAGHYFTAGDEADGYEEAYYADAYRAALELTSGEGRKSVFLPDEKLWFGRVMKYYDNMRERSYFSWLLDMNNAADQIIAYTSAEFAAANRDRLLRLKRAGNAELSSVRDFFAGDSGAEDIVRAADIIHALLNGHTDRSYDFFEPAFRGHYGIIRKMVRLLAAETGAAVNEQSAELVFLLRGKPQMRRYISALNKMTLDIWGSSVSRESANCCREAHIGTYIYKQPPILAFEPPVKVELPEDPEAFCGSRWRRRNFQDSLLRSGDADIAGSESRWILLDLCDVISPMTEYKGALFQTDDFIRRTDFYRSIQDECSDCWLFEKRSMKYCYDAMTQFAKMIKEKYGEHIILIKTEPKNRYIDLNYRLQHMQTDSMFAIKKKFISLCEERFANVTGCSVIDISGYFYASDSFPLGGADIVHYEDEFYRQAGAYISEMITGGSRRVFNKVDENYLLLRDMRIGR